MSLCRRLPIYHQLINDGIENSADLIIVSVGNSGIKCRRIANRIARRIKNQSKTVYRCEKIVISERNSGKATAKANASCKATAKANASCKATAKANASCKAVYRSFAAQPALTAIL